MNFSQQSLLVFLAVLSVSVIQGALYAGPGYKALEFAGSTWAQVPRGASMHAGKEFSFECWVNIPVADTTAVPPFIRLNRPIVSRYNVSVPAPEDKISDFNLQINPQGYVVFFVGGSLDLGFVMISNNPLEAERWYHVAFSIKYDDPSSNFPKSASLYVDNWSQGSLVRDRSDSVWYGPGYPRVVLTNEYIAIGRYQNDDSEYPLGQYFWGSLDECRLWMGSRLGSEFLNYANRTVNDFRNDIWINTPENGGISSNELVLSYNFNQEGSKLIDQTKNHYDALILGGPLSAEPQFTSSQIKLLTYTYGIGSVPVLIQLYGHESTDLDATNIQFRINYDSSSALKGELYEYDPLNSGSPDLANPYRPAGIVTPGIGNKIENNAIISTDKVVFIYVEQQAGGFTGKFFYTATDGNSFSALSAEVRASLSCNDPADVIDDCGVCNGENKDKDECDVCFGDNQSCAGCDGVPHSGLLYDDCGVCDGMNETCLGCDGVANSQLTYDICGICNGTGKTCKGCDGFGSDYDNCGVCNGTNTECAGCDGVANSGLEYDNCGVCNGGDNSCRGCDGIPNSGLQYDNCGICGENDESCAGCDGIANSGLEYDECGICGGDDTECLGCDGVAYSGYVYDFCGECGGNNGTCMGCDGSGGGEYDFCGVCRGNNDTCGGCDNEGSVYDECGVCGGDNSDCTCVEYHGYEVEELEYVLLQWGLNHTIEDINHIIKDLDQSLELLKDYTGDLDLATVVLYFNDFLTHNLDEYEATVDAFIKELDISLGLIYTGPPVNPVMPHH